jgi:hypothetical protein
MAGLDPAISIGCLLTGIASFASSVREEMAGLIIGAKPEDFGPAMTGWRVNHFGAWFQVSSAFTQDRMSRVSTNLTAMQCNH